MQSVFCRSYKEPARDFGQLCKIQRTEKPQLHSTGQLDCSRASVWTEPSLNRRFSVREGGPRSCARAPLLQNDLVYLVPTKHKLPFTATGSFLFSTWLLRSVLPQRHHGWARRWWESTWSCCSQNSARGAGKPGTQLYSVPPAGQQELAMPSKGAG